MPEGGIFWCAKKGNKVYFIKIRIINEKGIFSFFGTKENTFPGALKVIKLTISIDEISIKKKNIFIYLSSPKSVSEKI